MNTDLGFPLAHGGAGIRGSDLTIINAGHIQGGLGSDGITRANPIEFTGGTNHLTLLAGSNISGNVLAYSNLDTLELGGDADASLDTNPYKGFGRYVKTGSSTWTLTAGNQALTPWTVNAGTLAIASDSALGDLAGGLMLDGGALRTTADIQSSRPVVFGAAGGALSVDPGTTLTSAGTISGSGTMVKNGTGRLSLTGDSSAFAGSLSVDAGTFQLPGRLAVKDLTVSSGSPSVMEVVDGGMLRSDAGFVGGPSGPGELRVVGDGSRWETRYFNVQDGGSLAFRDGATVRSGSMSVTRSSMEMTGARTTLTGLDRSWLRDRAAVRVADGAQVEADLTSVAVFADDHGAALTIEGRDSRWQSRVLRIAEGGIGSVTVRDGGLLVSTESAAIAEGASGIGTAELTGSGSSWTARGSASVGQRGNGRLTIADGAMASGEEARVGEFAGATGSVLITGARSSWTLSGTLDLGPGSDGDATGSLTVRDGATVQAPHIVLSSAQGTGTLNIGAAPGEAAAGAGQVLANTVRLSSAKASLNFNHLDADHVFAPAIEGTGTVRVLSGGTRFAASSSGFQGPLQVSGGIALIDRVLGDGSVAATVSSGGTLGGAGTLGGTVNVAEGGHLLGRSGQTLTMGSLVLGDAANLDVALGAFSPNALFQVNGDLTLGGRLNVTDSGGFGAGIYRLINYTGMLTDNGLAIGSAPEGADLEVQTSVAQQVNLLNRRGMSLNFWDAGDSAAYNNGAVDGGTGRWNGSSTAWTGADGQINAAWKPGDFAVFQGKPGTVTIEDSASPLPFGGIQFAVDGYRLEGGALRTDKRDTLVRVGDGSAAGAAMRATIASPITGSGGLVKNDLGTLVLAGANSYAGPTTVSAGTLRADAPGALSSGSAFTVASGATLDLAGHSQTIASMAHSGTVNLAGSAPGTTLTVKGPWVGRGGTVHLATALGDSGSASDRLVLDGPAAIASGTTRIQVSNLGGLGALTTGNGIEVVTALNGATTTAQTTRDAFSLAGGHVDAGAYEYRLFAADADGKGENWYLRSSTSGPAPAPAPTPGAAPTPAPVPTYRTEVPLLAALPAQLRQADFAMLASSHRRSGDDDASAPAVAGLEPVAGTLTSDRRAWARAVHDDLDLRQPGTVAPASKGRVTGLQAGTDVFASDDGRWRSGVYVGSQDGRADVSGLASGLWRRVGTNDLQARYLGAYAGFENATGFYADAVLQYGTHSYTARPLGGLPVGGKGKSLTASLELGQAFRLAGSWTLEPQLQLMHRRARFDDAALPLALVRQDDDSGWQARAGVRIKGDFATAAGRLQPYARLDVHRGSGSSTAQFIGPGGSTGIASGMGHTSVGVAGGATLALGRSASLYGEIGKLFSTGNGAQVASSVQGAVGLRVRW